MKACSDARKFREVRNLAWPLHSIEIPRSTRAPVTYTSALFTFLEHFTWFCDLGHDGVTGPRQPREGCDCRGAFNEVPRRANNVTDEQCTDSRHLHIVWLTPCMRTSVRLKRPLRIRQKPRCTVKAHNEPSPQGARTCSTRRYRLELSCSQFHCTVTSATVCTENKQFDLQAHARARACARTHITSVSLVFRGTWSQTVSQLSTSKTRLSYILSEATLGTYVVRTPANKPIRSENRDYWSKRAMFIKAFLPWNSTSDDVGYAKERTTSSCACMIYESSELSSAPWGLRFHTPCW